MKSTLAPSQNVQDIRSQPKPKAPSKNPFSYAQDRDTLDITKPYNDPNPTPKIPNNPMQSAIDAIQKIGEAGNAALKKDIGKNIGVLNRTDQNGYNIRSRARTGALRPNTRSS